MAKIMYFSNKLCWLCLENQHNSFEIYGKHGIDLNVGAILEQHFWFEVGTFVAEKICENCWKKVESFHSFYNSVKAIHQQQYETRSEQTCETKAIIDNGLVFSIKEEPIDIKEVFDDFTDIVDTSATKCDELDNSTDAGPPIVAPRTRKPNYSHNYKTDIHTPLLSQYFNMTCDLCETKLLSYQDTKNHYKKVHDIKDGYLICCNNKFVKLKQMLAHCKWHTKQTDSLLSQVTACPSAEPTAYNSKPEFYTPLLSQYFKMECDLCETKLASYRETKKHFREVHNTKDGYLICCNRKYKNLPLMLTHCEWHINPDALKCSQCSKTFRDKYLLSRHINHAHLPETDQIFNCNDCDKKFSQQHLLKAHQRTCHNLSFKCPICQKYFTGKIHLRHHIRDVHSLEDELKFRSNLNSITKVDPVNEEAKKFECDICRIRYKFLSALRGHIKRAHCNVDGNVKLHMCEICAKPFKCSAEYKRHYVKVHSNVSEKVSEKVQCDICQKWLKNKSGLYVHFQRHNNEPATCKVCGRVCRNVHALRGHFHTAHREPSFECTICGKRFKYRNILKEHIAIHAGITDLYTCNLCPKTFRSKANMFTHRKRDHRAELEKIKKTETNC